MNYIIQLKHFNSALKCICDLYSTEQIHFCQVNGLCILFLFFYRLGPKRENKP